MSSEKLGHHNNVLKGDLGGAFDILTGSTGEQTDLGVAKKFGGAAAAFSVRDIGAMNGRVIKVRREQDNGVEDFSALQVSSGSIEQFTIGQSVLDKYNNAAYFLADSAYFSVTETTYSGAFTITFSFILTGDLDDNNQTTLVWGQSGKANISLDGASEIRFRRNDGGSATNSDITLDSNIKKNFLHTLTLTRDSSNVITLTLDGATQSNTATSAGDFSVARMGFRNRGSVFDVNINSGEHIYAGNGAEASNWVDTGSGTTANASKNGSPVAFTGQGISAFVDTWYDQSGNGNNVTQDTTGSQPLIIENGSLVKDGNNPTIKFDGTDDFLQITSQVLSNSSSGAVGLYSVVNSTASQSGYVAGSSSDDSGGKRGMSIYAGTGKFILTNGNSASTSSQDTIPITNGSSVLISACYNDNEINTLQKDSSTTGYSDGSAAYNFLASSSFTIGHRERSAGTNAATNLTGTISEVLAFNTDTTSDRGEIQSEIQNYYNL